MKKTLILVVVLLVIYVAARGFNKKEESMILPPQDTEQGLDDSTPVLNSGRSSQAAKVALAEKLTISESDISVVSAIGADWSDSCLGLGGPEVMCATVITPGYRVTLSANGKNYIYRTDADGSYVVEEK